MSKLTSAVTVKLLFAAMIVTGVTTAAATSVLVHNPNPVIGVEGSLSGATDITVDGQSLTYDGLNVTGANVIVNNTGDGPHNVTVNLALKNGSTTVASATTNYDSIPAGETADVTVTVSSSVSLRDVDRVEVSVERTT